MNDIELLHDAMVEERLQAAQIWLREQYEESDRAAQITPMGYYLGMRRAFLEVGRRFFGWED